MKCAITSLMAIFCLLSLIGPARAGELEDLQAELEDYKARLEEVKYKLAQTQEHQSELLNQIDELNKQMYDLEADYSFYQTKLDQVGQSIDLASSSIEKKDAEVKVIDKALKERQDLLAQRLITLYKLTRGKYLEVLLSSADFHQFGARIAYFQRVFREDQSLLEQTKQLISSLQVEKTQLQEQKELLLRQQEQYALLQTKAELQKSTLEEEFFTRKSELVWAAEEQSALEGEESELVALIEQDQQYIAQLLTGHDFVYTGAPSDAGLIWPVSGPITSEFGWRSWGDFHRGIDIGAPYGTSVAAAADGIVIAAEYLGTYGNLIIIDHLNGLSTVYAHLSGYAVDVGEEVARGMVIGWVGMTGLTTGPHLHFEVRVSGEFVDPLGWLP